jgi:hypothetical protein
MKQMKVALGRQRELVVRIQAHPARPVYVGSVVAGAYQQRQLLRELRMALVARQRLPYGAQSWHSGL